MPDKRINRTRKGTPITDELVDELAREAEAGYDLSHGRRVARSSDGKLTRPPGPRTLDEVSAQRPHVRGDAIGAERERIEREALGAADEHAHPRAKPEDHAT